MQKNSQLMSRSKKLNKTQKFQHAVKSNIKPYQYLSLKPIAILHPHKKTN